MNRFPRIAPSYGRPRYSYDGPTIRPSSTVRDEPRSIGAAERDTLAAQRARHDFAWQTRKGAFSTDPTPRLRDTRPARFTNRPTWS